MKNTNLPLVVLSSTRVWGVAALVTKRAQDVYIHRSPELYMQQLPVWKPASTGLPAISISD